MPPFRPLLRIANLRSLSRLHLNTPKKFILYDFNLEWRKENTHFKSTLRMTLGDISKFGYSEQNLTLPELPEEYLDIAIVDNDIDEVVDEILVSCPLAVSDVTAESILDAKKITTGDDVKEIYSLELSNKFLTYEPGGTIGILTQNRAADVKELFNHLGISNLAGRKCRVTEKSTAGKKLPPKPIFLNKIVSLKYLFTFCLDIQCMPKKSLIRVLAESTNNFDERRELEQLCSKENSDIYVKKILEANETFLNLLLKYPSCCPPVARLIENLPKLQPRPYSIASSQLASPNSIRIVFSVVKNENGKEQEGLCTGMLKDMISRRNNEEVKVKMYFRKCNDFKLTDTDVPLILIGPGTGISPYIGFLEHRKVQERKGKIFLFYGCRYKTKDYLFKKELQEFLDCGILTKLTVAFSRESDEEAKYVQDNLKKCGEEICQLIFEENAVIYVCGDAKNMRKDVQSAFVEIFEKHKSMSPKEAMDCIKKLTKEKRYLQDIWL